MRFDIAASFKNLCDYFRSPNWVLFSYFQVTTVDMQKPPPDFRTNFEATHPPILIDNGLAILENDKIERHIMKSVPGGYNLFVQVG